jgi:hypothetical protein
MARDTRADMDVLLTWRPGWKDTAEIVLLTSTLPLYYLVRGQAKERVGEAVSRGVDIVRFEQNLGIFWEVQLQRAILDYDWLVQGLNAFYLYGHLPVIGALALWLYFWHRPQYLLMRNAFLISGAIGLVFYLNFPTAPPRLLAEHGFDFGLVDTVVKQYHEGRPLTPNFFVNQYAALPSLHFGWNMLVGVALWLATKNILIRIFAVLMPLAMFADIILTANHYIVDAVAALPVVLIGIAITLAVRWLVVRVLSVDSKTAKDKGWVSWVYWLVGVTEPSETQSRTRTGHPI